MTDDTPQRILLIGDTHCNAHWTCFVIDQAEKLGVDLIVQLGDFGYWPRMAQGKHFLEWVDRTLDEAGIPLWFLDGNHEDHATLASDLMPPGFHRITDHITYLARGTRWEWDGTESPA